LGRSDATASKLRPAELAMRACARNAYLTYVVDFIPSPRCHLRCFTSTSPERPLAAQVVRSDRLRVRPPYCSLVPHRVTGRTRSRALWPISLARRGAPDSKSWRQLCARWVLVYPLQSRFPSVELPVSDSAIGAAASVRAEFGEMMYFSFSPCGSGVLCVVWGVSLASRVPIGAIPRPFPRKVTFCPRRSRRESATMTGHR
jgi:hypothetical protein